MCPNAQSTHAPALSRKRGFTLIEVLVVVAIIALLVAVLLPSLQRARNQAKALACLANQKQLGTAFEYYHIESKKYVPPFCFIRRINNNPNDFINVPAWYQYITYRYLHNNTDVTICPVDDLVEIQNGGKRGPHRELRGFSPRVYYSYAINAVFPKSATPITMDPNDVRPRLTAAEIPDGVIERFNPGVVAWIKRPSETMFLLETASPEMLNPRYTITRYYRVQHGGEKDRMNIVLADGHAESKAFKDIWPGDFTKRPPVHLGTADKWPARYRQLWYGDPNALYIVQK